jgi:hypothetical protein
MQKYGEVEVQLPTSLTSAIDGGEWTASNPNCFTPGEPPVPTGKETEWAPEQVQMLWQREKFLPLPGIKHLSSSTYTELFQLLVLIITNLKTTNNISSSFTICTLLIFLG